MKLDVLSKIKVPDQIKDVLEDEQAKMFIQIGAAVVIIVMYAAFALVPQYADMAGLSRKIREMNDKISLETNRIRKLSDTTQRLERLRSELATYSRGLPEEKQIPEMLEELSFVAKTSMVKILSITPVEDGSVEADQANEYYREIPIVITAKSGYHQLGRFISNLEESKRFITIDDLRVQDDKKTPRSHDIRMVLKTYVSLEGENNTGRKEE